MGSYCREIFYTDEKLNDLREKTRDMRKKYLRYKEAESVYSLTHKKLLELASDAGAIYRMDGTVLIDRDIFNEYLERYHEAPRKVPNGNQTGRKGK